MYIYIYIYIYQQAGETEEDQGKDGLRTSKKIYIMRRLKPTVGCNASKRRRRYSYIS